MAKQIVASMSVGDLSEILILSVLEKLGGAPIPVIVQSLAEATKKGKAPFVIGPSVEQVLRSREIRKEVIVVRRNQTITYRVTEQGRRTVESFSTVVHKFFPAFVHFSR